MGMKGGLMIRLNEIELNKIRGGAVGTTILIGIGVVALIVFLSGVISGYTNPEECHND